MKGLLVVAAVIAGVVYVTSPPKWLASVVDLKNALRGLRGAAPAPTAKADGGEEPS